MALNKNYPFFTHMEPYEILANLPMLDSFVEFLAENDRMEASIELSIWALQMFTFLSETRKRLNELKDVIEAIEQCDEPYKLSAIDQAWVEYKEKFNENF